MMSDKYYHNYKVIENPDPVFLKNLKKKIKNNNGFCPSKLERCADNKCPCTELTESGECECGLYIRVPSFSDDWGVKI